MGAEHWEHFWAKGGKGDHAIGAPPQRAFLARHWRSVFAARPTRSNNLIIDIAAGDGAILKIARECLDRDGRTAHLIAVDAAPSASHAACRAVTRIDGIAADAALLPFADRTIDIAVSQFGLEYAGVRAFVETARVLRNGGFFSAVCHLKGGEIEAECAENARVLQMLRDFELLERARQAWRHSFSRGAMNDTLELALRSSAQDVVGELLSAPESAAKRFLSRLMSDLSSMTARRSAYEPSEALAWLDHVEDSLHLYLQRMSSMRAAALGPDHITEIRNTFSDQGFETFNAKAAAFSDGAPMAAWIIEAEARPPLQTNMMTSHNLALI